MNRKLLHPGRLEWISFATLMPILGVILNYLLFGNEAFHRADAWYLSFPILMATGLVSWYLHVIVMYALRHRFTKMHQTILRLALLAIAHVALVSLTFEFIFRSYELFNYPGYVYNAASLRQALYLGIALTLVATTMWESDYTIRQWRSSLEEKEKLEQLRLQHEFDTLKGQVNPHFLFNCFNTLSSLIPEDKKQAEIFLNELSKVYRYLLKNNEDGLSTLYTELQFIESYYRLLKTRHGDAVQINIEADKRYHSYQLPTLSLQLLVENAVKHNVLSKNHPLVIDIFTTSNNNLVVSNNLQLRSVKAPSNKIGLENIRLKYQLLQQTGFQVLQDKNSFTVVLPLLWNKITTFKIIAEPLKMKQ